MKNVADIIADNIRSRRKELGLTQGELASVIGYSTKAISKWESGKGVPPTVMLPQLARVLQTDVDRLLRERSESRYFLGVDGGGTKTEFALADSDGNILKTATLGTSNPNDIGISSTLDILRMGIFEVCGNVPMREISLFAGLAGGSTSGVADQIYKFLEKFGFARVEIASDAINAVAAGLGESDGIIVIMGTGSIIFAQRDRHTYRVGGYGYLLGDEGSGFALGSQAIHAALTYEDGSGAPTLLYETVREKCGKQKVLECIGELYSGGKREIASYASLVFEACKKGDAVAKEIILRNLRAVSRSIVGAAKHLDVNEPKKQVVLCGGVSMHHSDIIIPILKELLANEAGEYEVTVCSRPIIQGALMLAGMPKH